jgi:protein TonB
MSTPSKAPHTRASTALSDIVLPRAPKETTVKLTALGIAVVLHIAALLVNLPALRSPVPVTSRSHRPIVVKRYIPPPPRIEQPRQTVRKRLTRKMPIPDPTPDAPEPIREPVIPAPPPALSADYEFLIGDPEPPPEPGSGGQAGPLLAGVDATNPVRIEESCVDPEYPEIARIARIEGNVILQAVVECDGSVGEIRVLRCSKPGFGFEEASIAAVSQWRYEPARQNDLPVSVYFTVLVDFTLL